MRVPTCRRRHADADADADMTTCCVACKSEPSEELRLAADRIHLLHLNTPAEEGSRALGMGDTSLDR